MALLLLIGTFGMTWGQNLEKKHFVKHIVLESDPNPRFIRITAESLIPWDGYTTDKDIKCLKKRLMETGIFRKIETRLYKLNDSGDFDLILKTRFKSPNPIYKLKTIEVEGVDGVDYSKFAILASKSLVGHPLSLSTVDYADFVDNVFQLLQQSIPDETKREWSRPPWVELKLNRDNELEVKLVSDFKACR